MPRALTQLLPEDHRLIEKRSCKRRDSNEPPNYRNVSFSLSSAACFFDRSQSHRLSLRYNDVSSCFLVCADNDPMASVSLFCFDRTWRPFHRQNRFRRSEKKQQ